MKKRLISLLVALCMAVTLLPVSAVTAWAEGGGSTLKPLQFRQGYPVITDDMPSKTDSKGHTIYTGDGWSYDGTNKVLTLAPENPTTYDLIDGGSIRPDQNSILCSAIIGQNATIVNGNFWDDENPNVSITNYGAITGGIYYTSITNYGTIENGIIEKAFDNYGTVKNSYFIAPSSKVTNHNGLMPGCLFTGKPEGIESHTITEVEDYYIAASLADISDISFEVTQNKFYFTGTPKVRVNLVKDRKAKPVTSINQKLNYGELIEDSSRYPVGYIFTVENDNKDVVLNQGTYSTLKMADDGTPITTGLAHISDGNFHTYFGNGWHSQALSGNPGTIYLESGSYNFLYTDPVNKNGENLSSVNYGIVNEGSIIEDGVFHNAVANGWPNGDSTKTPKIKGGTFAAGLYSNNGEITGGAFNGKDSIRIHGTVLSGNYRSVTVKDGAILKVNDTLPLVYNETTYDLVQGHAWDLYSYAGTVLTVESNVDITNINGQKIGEAFSSSYPNGETNKKVVRFEMPDSDVELNSTKIVVPDPKPEPKPEPEAPTYTLTVKGGTFTYNGSEAMTSASVPVDAEVKVTLNRSAVPEGMVFDLWAMDEASLLGNPAVAYNEESFTIPAGSVAKGSTVTVEAQYRDATIESEPSILGTAAIIGVAGAGTAVIVWQGYRIGMELYEKYFQPTPEETAAEQPAPEAPAAAAAF